MTDLEIERFKRLYSLRIDLGLTQKEFASDLGIATTNYTSMETGGRGISMTIAAKIHVLHPNVEIEWLMHGKGGRPQFLGHAGLKLKSFRDSLGLSIKEFAESINMHMGQIEIRKRNALWFREDFIQTVENKYPGFRDFVKHSEMGILPGIEINYTNPRNGALPQKNFSTGNERPQDRISEIESQLNWQQSVDITLKQLLEEIKKIRENKKGE